MENNRYIWQNWVHVLHAWGIHELTAALLEATGPINFIGAQAVYLSQPVLNIFLSEEKIDAFADLLGNPVDTKTFVESLRKRT